MKHVERTKVAVLGATGLVGQMLVARLADHPWFELDAVLASDRSKDRAYGAAVDWRADAPLPLRAARLRVGPCEPDPRWPLVFSALDAEVAGPIETAFARGGSLVVTNTRCHRLDSSVPLIVPEVNPSHLSLLAHQEFERGGLIANPNCTTAGLVLALAPLHARFGVASVHVVTLQALSGAGLLGPTALAAHDNVIPFIAGEEEKIANETRKILGRIGEGRVSPAELAITAQCNRVPVLDGHLLCVALTLHEPASNADILFAWEAFRGEPQRLALPSAPELPVHYLHEQDAPQPRRQRGAGNGMTTSIGRLREVSPRAFLFHALTHNLVRGAAGGAILAAELAFAERYGAANEKASARRFD